MIGTTAALLGSAGISAGASILSSLLGGGAAKKAAQQQVDAQNKVIQNTNEAVATGKGEITAATGQANDTLTESQRKQLELFAPYLEAGTISLDQLKQLTGGGGALDKQFEFNPTDLAKDPGYAFTLAEGKKAIERSAAAKGGLFSGSTLKSLGGWTEDRAGMFFNDAFERARSTFDTNRSTALSRIGSLQNLASLGYNGTAASGGAVANTENQIAANLKRTGEQTADIGIRGSENVARAVTSKGNSEAAGTVGNANAWQGAIGGVSRSIQDFLTMRKAKNSNSGGIFDGISTPGWAHP